MFTFLYITQINWLCAPFLIPTNMKKPLFLNTIICGQLADDPKDINRIDIEATEAVTQRYSLKKVFLKVSQKFTGK